MPANAGVYDALVSWRAFNGRIAVSIPLSRSETFASYLLFVKDAFAFSACVCVCARDNSEDTSVRYSDATGHHRFLRRPVRRFGRRIVVR